ncbi:unnamed protein product, partial [Coccothraustes coccothraustes]
RDRDMFSVLAQFLRARHSEKAFRKDAEFKRRRSLRYGAVRSLPVTFFAKTLVNDWGMFAVLAQFLLKRHRGIAFRKDVGDKRCRSQRYGAVCSVPVTFFAKTLVNDWGMFAVLAQFLLKRHGGIAFCEDVGDKRCRSQRYGAVRSLPVTFFAKTLVNDWGMFAVLAQFLLQRHRGIAFRKDVGDKRCRSQRYGAVCSVPVTFFAKTLVNDWGMFAVLAEFLLKRHGGIAFCEDVGDKRCRSQRYGAVRSLPVTFFAKTLVNDWGMFAVLAQFLLKRHRGIAFRKDVGDKRCRSQRYGAVCSVPVTFFAKTLVNDWGMFAVLAEFLLKRHGGIAFREDVGDKRCRSQRYGAVCSVPVNFFAKTLVNDWGMFAVLAQFLLKRHGGIAFCEDVGDKRCRSQRYGAVRSLPVTFFAKTLVNDWGMFAVLAQFLLQRHRGIAFRKDVGDKRCRSQRYGAVCSVPVTFFAKTLVNDWGMFAVLAEFLLKRHGGIAFCEDVGDKRCRSQRYGAVRSLPVTFFAKTLVNDWGMFAVLAQFLLKRHRGIAFRKDVGDKRCRSQRYGAVCSVPVTFFAKTLVNDWGMFAVLAEFLLKRHGGIAFREDVGDKRCRSQRYGAVRSLPVTFFAKTLVNDWGMFAVLAQFLLQKHRGIAFRKDVGDKRCRSQRYGAVCSVPVTFFAKTLVNDWGMFAVLAQFLLKRHRGIAFRKDVGDKRCRSQRYGAVCSLPVTFFAKTLVNDWGMFAVLAQFLLKRHRGIAFRKDVGDKRCRSQRYGAVCSLPVTFFAKTLVNDWGMFAMLAQFLLKRHRGIAFREDVGDKRCRSQRYGAVRSVPVTFFAKTLVNDWGMFAVLAEFLLKRHGGIAFCEDVGDKRCRSQRYGAVRSVPVTFFAKTLVNDWGMFAVLAEFLLKRHGGIAFREDVGDKRCRSQRYGAVRSLPVTFFAKTLLNDWGMFAVLAQFLLKRHRGIAFREDVGDKRCRSQRYGAVRSVPVTFFAKPLVNDWGMFAVLAEFLLKRHGGIAFREDVGDKRCRSQRYGAVRSVPVTFFAKPLVNDWGMFAVLAEFLLKRHRGIAFREDVGDKRCRSQRYGAVRSVPVTFFAKTLVNDWGMFAVLAEFLLKRHGGIAFREDVGDKRCRSQRYGAVRSLPVTFFAKTLVNDWGMFAVLAQFLLQRHRGIAFRKDVGDKRCRSQRYGAVRSVPVTFFAKTLVNDWGMFAVLAEFLLKRHGGIAFREDVGDKRCRSQRYGAVRSVPVTFFAKTLVNDWGMFAVLAQFLLKRHRGIAFRKDVGDKRCRSQRYGAVCSVPVTFFAKTLLNDWGMFAVLAQFLLKRHRGIAFREDVGDKRCRSQRYGAVRSVPVSFFAKTLVNDWGMFAVLAEFLLKRHGGIAFCEDVGDKRCRSQRYGAVRSLPVTFFAKTLVNDWGMFAVLAQFLLKRHRGIAFRKDVGDKRCRSQRYGAVRSVPVTFFAKTLVNDWGMFAVLAEFLLKRHGGIAFREDVGDKRCRSQRYGAVRSVPVTFFAKPLVNDWGMFAVLAEFLLKRHGGIAFREDVGDKRCRSQRYGAVRSVPVTFFAKTLVNDWGMFAVLAEFLLKRHGGIAFREDVGDKRCRSQRYGAVRSLPVTFFAKTLLNDWGMFAVLAQFLLKRHRGIAFREDVGDKRCRSQRYGAVRSVPVTFFAKTLVNDWGMFAVLAEFLLKRHGGIAFREDVGDKRCRSQRYGAVRSVPVTFFAKTLLNDWGMFAVLAQFLLKRHRGIAFREDVGDKRCRSQRYGAVRSVPVTFFAKTLVNDWGMFAVLAEFLLKRHGGIAFCEDVGDKRCRSQRYGAVRSLPVTFFAKTLVNDWGMFAVLAQFLLKRHRGIAFRKDVGDKRCRSQRYGAVRSVPVTFFAKTLVNDWGMFAVLAQFLLKRHRGIAFRKDVGDKRCRSQRYGAVRSVPVTFFAKTLVNDWGMFAVLAQFLLKRHRGIAFRKDVGDKRCRSQRYGAVRSVPVTFFAKTLVNDWGMFAVLAQFLLKRHRGIAFREDVGDKRCRSQRYGAVRSVPVTFFAKTLVNDWGMFAVLAQFLLKRHSEKAFRKDAEFKRRRSLRYGAVRSVPVTFFAKTLVNDWGMFAVLAEFLLKRHGGIAFCEDVGDKRCRSQRYGAVRSVPVTFFAKTLVNDWGMFAVLAEFLLKRHGGIAFREDVGDKRCRSQRYGAVRSLPVTFFAKTLVNDWGMFAVLAQFLLKRHRGIAFREDVGDKRCRSQRYGAVRSLPVTFFAKTLVNDWGMFAVLAQFLLKRHSEKAFRKDAEFKRRRSLRYGAVRSVPVTFFAKTLVNDWGMFAVLAEFLLKRHGGIAFCEDVGDKRCRSQRYGAVRSVPVTFFAKTLVNDWGMFAVLAEFLLKRHGGIAFREDVGDKRCRSQRYGAVRSVPVTFFAKTLLNDWGMFAVLAQFLLKRHRGIAFREDVGDKRCRSQRYGAVRSLPVTFFAKTLVNDWGMFAVLAQFLLKRHRGIAFREDVGDKRCRSQRYGAVRSLPVTFFAKTLVNDWGMFAVLAQFLLKRHRGIAFREDVGDKRCRSQRYGAVRSVPVTFFAKTLVNDWGMFAVLAEFLLKRHGGIAFREDVGDKRCRSQRYGAVRSVPVTFFAKPLVNDWGMFAVLAEFLLKRHGGIAFREDVARDRDMFSVLAQFLRARHSEKAFRKDAEFKRRRSLRYGAVRSVPVTFFAKTLLNDWGMFAVLAQFLLKRHRGIAFREDVGDKRCRSQRYGAVRSVPVSFFAKTLVNDWGMFAVLAEFLLKRHGGIAFCEDVGDKRCRSQRYGAVRSLPVTFFAKTLVNDWGMFAVLAQFLLKRHRGIAFREDVGDKRCRSQRYGAVRSLPVTFFAKTLVNDWGMFAVLAQFLLKRHRGIAFREDVGDKRCRSQRYGAVRSVPVTFFAKTLVNDWGMFAVLAEFLLKRHGGIAFREDVGDKRCRSQRYGAVRSVPVTFFAKPLVNDWGMFAVLAEFLLKRHGGIAFREDVGDKRCRSQRYGAVRSVPVTFFAKTLVNDWGMFAVLAEFLLKRHGGIAFREDVGDKRCRSQRYGAVRSVPVTFFAKPLVNDWGMFAVLAEFLLKRHRGIAFREDVGDKRCRSQRYGAVRSVPVTFFAKTLVNDWGMFAVLAQFLRARHSEKAFRKDAEFKRRRSLRYGAVRSVPVTFFAKPLVNDWGMFAVLAEFLLKRHGGIAFREDVGDKRCRSQRYGAVRSVPVTFFAKTLVNDWGMFAVLAEFLLKRHGGIAFCEDVGDKRCRSQRYGAVRSVPVTFFAKTLLNDWGMFAVLAQFLLKRHRGIAFREDVGDKRCRSQRYGAVRSVPVTFFAKTLVNDWGMFAVLAEFLLKRHGGIAFREDVGDKRCRSQRYGAVRSLPVTFFAKTLVNDWGMFAVLAQFLLKRHRGIAFREDVGDKRCRSQRYGAVRSLPVTFFAKTLLNDWGMFAVLAQFLLKRHRGIAFREDVGDKRCRSQRYGAVRSVPVTSFAKTLVNDWGMFAVLAEFLLKRHGGIAFREDVGDKRCRSQRYGAVCSVPVTFFAKTLVNDWGMFAVLAEFLLKRHGGIAFREDVGDKRCRSQRYGAVRSVPVTFFAKPLVNDWGMFAVLAEFLLKRHRGIAFREDVGDKRCRSQRYGAVRSLPVTFFAKTLLNDWGMFAVLAQFLLKRHRGIAFREDVGDKRCRSQRYGAVRSVPVTFFAKTLVNDWGMFAVLAEFLLKRHGGIAFREDVGDKRCRSQRYGAVRSVPVTFFAKTLVNDWGMFAVLAEFLLKRHGGIAFCEDVGDKRCRSQRYGAVRSLPVTFFAKTLVNDWGMFAVLAQFLLKRHRGIAFRKDVGDKRCRSQRYGAVRSVPVTFFAKTLVNDWGMFAVLAQFLLKRHRGIAFREDVGDKRRRSLKYGGVRSVPVTFFAKTLVNDWGMFAVLAQFLLKRHRGIAFRKDVGDKRCRSQRYGAVRSVPVTFFAKTLVNDWGMFAVLAQFLLKRHRGIAFREDVGDKRCRSQRYGAVRSVPVTFFAKTLVNDWGMFAVLAQFLLKRHSEKAFRKDAEFKRRRSLRYGAVRSVPVTFFAKTLVNDWGMFAVLAEFLLKRHGGIAFREDVGDKRCRSQRYGAVRSVPVTFFAKTLVNDWGMFAVLAEFLLKRHGGIAFREDVGDKRCRSQRYGAVRSLPVTFFAKTLVNDWGIFAVLAQFLLKRHRGIAFREDVGDKRCRSQRYGAVRSVPVTFFAKTLVNDWGMFAVLAEFLLKRHGGIAFREDVGDKRRRSLRYGAVRSVPVTFFAKTLVNDWGMFAVLAQFLLKRHRGIAFRKDVGDKRCRSQRYGAVCSLPVTFFAKTLLNDWGMFAVLAQFLLKRHRGIAFREDVGDKRCRSQRYGAVRSVPVTFFAKTLVNDWGMFAVLAEFLLKRHGGIAFREDVGDKRCRSQRYGAVRSVPVTFFAKTLVNDWGMFAVLAQFLLKRHRGIAFRKDVGDKRCRSQRYGAVCSVPVTFFAKTLLNDWGMFAVLAQFLLKRHRGIAIREDVGDKRCRSQRYGAVRSVPVTFFAKTLVNDWGMFAVLAQFLLKRHRGIAFRKDVGDKRCRSQRYGAVRSLPVSFFAKTLVNDWGMFAVLAQFLLKRHRGIAFRKDVGDKRCRSQRYGAVRSVPVTFFAKTLVNDWGMFAVLAQFLLKRHSEKAFRKDAEFKRRRSLRYGAVRSVPVTFFAKTLVNDWGMFAVLAEFLLKRHGGIAFREDVGDKRCRSQRYGAVRSLPVTFFAKTLLNDWGMFAVLAQFLLKRHRGIAFREDVGDKRCRSQRYGAVRSVPVTFFAKTLVNDWGMFAVLAEFLLKRHGGIAFREDVGDKRCRSQRYGAVRSVPVTFFAKTLVNDWGMFAVLAQFLLKRHRGIAFRKDVGDKRCRSQRYGAVCSVPVTFFAKTLLNDWGMFAVLAQFLLKRHRGIAFREDVGDKRCRSQRYGAVRSLPVTFFAKTLVNDWGMFAVLAQFLLKRHRGIAFRKDVGDKRCRSQRYGAVRSVPVTFFAKTLVNDWGMFAVLAQFLLKRHSEKAFRKDAEFKRRRSLRYGAVRSLPVTFFAKTLVNDWGMFAVLAQFLLKRHRGIAFREDVGDKRCRSQRYGAVRSVPVTFFAKTLVNDWGMFAVLAEFLLKRHGGIAFREDVGDKRCRSQRYGAVRSVPVTFFAKTLLNDWGMFAVLAQFLLKRHRGIAFREDVGDKRCRSQRYGAVRSVPVTFFAKTLVNDWGMFAVLAQFLLKRHRGIAFRKDVGDKRCRSQRYGAVRSLPVTFFAKTLVNDWGMFAVLAQFLLKRHRGIAFRKDVGDKRCRSQRYGAVRSVPVTFFAKTLVNDWGMFAVLAQFLLKRHSEKAFRKDAEFKRRRSLRYGAVRSVPVTFFAKTLVNDWGMFAVLAQFLLKRHRGIAFRKDVGDKRCRSQRYGAVRSVPVTFFAKTLVNDWGMFAVLAEFLLKRHGGIAFREDVGDKRCRSQRYGAVRSVPVTFFAKPLVNDWGMFAVLAEFLLKRHRGIAFREDVGDKRCRSQRYGAVRSLPVTFFAKTLLNDWGMFAVLAQFLLKRHRGIAFREDVGDKRCRSQRYGAVRSVPVTFFAKTLVNDWGMFAVLAEFLLKRHRGIAFREDVGDKRCRSQRYGAVRSVPVTFFAKTLVNDWGMFAVLAQFLLKRHRGIAFRKDVGDKRCRSQRYGAVCSVPVTFFAKPLVNDWGMFAVLAEFLLKRHRGIAFREDVGDKRCRSQRYGAVRSLPVTFFAKTLLNDWGMFAVLAQFLLKRHRGIAFREDVGDKRCRSQRYGAVRSVPVTFFAKTLVNDWGMFAVLAEFLLKRHRGIAFREDVGDKRCRSQRYGAVRSVPVTFFAKTLVNDWGMFAVLAQFLLKRHRGIAFRKDVGDKRCRSQRYGAVCSVPVTFFAKTLVNDWGMFAVLAEFLLKRHGGIAFREDVGDKRCRSQRYGAVRSVPVTFFAKTLVNDWGMFAVLAQFLLKRHRGIAFRKDVGDKRCRSQRYGAVCSVPVTFFAKTLLNDWGMFAVLAQFLLKRHRGIAFREDVGDKRCRSQRYGAVRSVPVTFFAKTLVNDWGMFAVLAQFLLKRHGGIAFREDVGDKRCRSQRYGAVRSVPVTFFAKTLVNDWGMFAVLAQFLLKRHRGIAFRKDVGDKRCRSQRYGAVRSVPVTFFAKTLLNDWGMFAVLAQFLLKRHSEKAFRKDAEFKRRRSLRYGAVRSVPVTFFAKTLVNDWGMFAVLAQFLLKRHGGIAFREDVGDKRCRSQRYGAVRSVPVTFFAKTLVNDWGMFAVLAQFLLKRHRGIAFRKDVGDKRCRSQRYGAVRSVPVTFFAKTLLNDWGMFAVLAQFLLKRHSEKAFRKDAEFKRRRSLRYGAVRSVPVTFFAKTLVNDWGMFAVLAQFLLKRHGGIAFREDVGDKRCRSQRYGAVRSVPVTFFAKTLVNDWGMFAVLAQFLLKRHRGIAFRKDVGDKRCRSQRYGAVRSVPVTFFAKTLLNDWGMFAVLAQFLLKRHSEKAFRKDAEFKRRRSLRYGAVRSVPVTFFAKTLVNDWGMFAVLAEFLLKRHGGIAFREDVGDKRCRSQRYGAVRSVPVTFFAKTLVNDWGMFAVLAQFLLKRHRGIAFRKDVGDKRCRSQRYGAVCSVPVTFFAKTLVNDWGMFAVLAEFLLKRHGGIAFREDVGDKRCRSQRYGAVRSVPVTFFAKTLLNDWGMFAVLAQFLLKRHRGIAFRKDVGDKRCRSQRYGAVRSVPVTFFAKTLLNDWGMFAVLAQFLLKRHSEKAFRKDAEFKRRRSLRYGAVRSVPVTFFAKTLVNDWGMFAVLAEFLLKRHGGIAFREDVGDKRCRSQRYGAVRSVPVTFFAKTLVNDWGMFAVLAQFLLKRHRGIAFRKDVGDKRCRSQRYGAVCSVPVTFFAKTLVNDWGMFAVLAEFLLKRHGGIAFREDVGDKRCRSQRYGAVRSVPVTFFAKTLVNDWGMFAVLAQFLLKRHRGIAFRKDVGDKRCRSQRYGAVCSVPVTFFAKTLVNDWGMFAVLAEFLLKRHGGIAFREDVGDKRCRSQRYGAVRSVPVTFFAKTLVNDWGMFAVLAQFLLKRHRGIAFRKDVGDKRCRSQRYGAVCSVPVSFFAKTLVNDWGMFAVLAQFLLKRHRGIAFRKDVGDKRCRSQRYGAVRSVPVTFFAKTLVNDWGMFAVLAEFLLKRHGGIAFREDVGDKRCRSQRYGAVRSVPVTFFAKTLVNDWGMFAVLAQFLLKRHRGIAFRKDVGDKRCRSQRYGAVCSVPVSFFAKTLVNDWGMFAVLAQFLLKRHRGIAFREDVGDKRCRSQRYGAVRSVPVTFFAKTLVNDWGMFAVLAEFLLKRHGGIAFRKDVGDKRCRSQRYGAVRSVPVTFFAKTLVNDWGMFAVLAQFLLKRHRGIAFRKDVGDKRCRSQRHGAVRSVPVTFFAKTLVNDWGMFAVLAQFLLKRHRGIAFRKDVGDKRCRSQRYGAVCSVPVSFFAKTLVNDWGMFAVLAQFLLKRHRGIAFREDVGDKRCRSQRYGAVRSVPVTFFAKTLVNDWGMFAVLAEFLLKRHGGIAFRKDVGDKRCRSQRYGAVRSVPVTFFAKTLVNDWGMFAVLAQFLLKRHRGIAFRKDVGDKRCRSQRYGAVCSVPVSFFAKTLVNDWGMFAVLAQFLLKRHRGIAFREDVGDKRCRSQRYGAVRSVPVTFFAKTLVNDWGMFAVLAEFLLKRHGGIAFREDVGDKRCRSQRYGAVRSVPVTFFAKTLVNDWGMFAVLAQFLLKRHRGIAFRKDVGDKRCRSQRHGAVRSVPVTFFAKTLVNDWGMFAVLAQFLLKRHSEKAFRKDAEFKRRRSLRYGAVRR